METYWFPTTEKWLFCVLEMSFSLFLTFISGNRLSLSSDVENVIEVSPSSSPSQETSTATDAVPSSSL